MATSIEASTGAPSLQARAMNDASATVGESQSEADAPAVAEGDVERPLDEGLNDLGWSEDPDVPTPMMHGLKNEDVWQLVRRFNKQTYHIKAIQIPPQGGIDMNIADKDAFTPDKLRSTLERIYMTVGLGLAAFVKHIARIRSWTEWKRTSVFLAVFLAVWLCNAVMTGLFTMLVGIIASPHVRKVMFPPAPLAAISASTGKAKVPKAGQLGSDSLTGAAESYKGEAVEQEASNLVGSVAHMAVSTAIGNDASKVQKYDEAEDTEDDDDEDLDSAASKSKTEKVAEVVPDPASLTLASKEGQSKASGDKKHSDGQTDASAAPVSKSVWDGAQPVLHTLEDLADTWERFANALAPTHPFAKRGPRTQMAAIVAPIALLSMFLSVEMVYRSTTLLIGLLFFGQPVLDHLKISPLKEWLDKRVPDWPRYLELRNSILKGVPTDAQLTITLLRIGEAHKSPLPPPPPAANAPPPTAKDGKAMLHDVPDEYKEEMERSISDKQQADAEEEEENKTPKKKSKIMAILKGGTRAGANTVLGANRVKAEVGFEQAKQRVGVVQTQPSAEATGDGPASFHARFKGKRGLVLISTTATTPCVSFEKVWPAHAKAAQVAYVKAKASYDAKQSEHDDTPEGDKSAKMEPDALKMLRDVAEKARPTPSFSIQIDAIRSIRKLGGLGWKGKMIVGWAMDGQVEDGLEIVTDDGKTVVVTALPRRDEVFNRLAGMGKDHVWEAW